MSRNCGAHGEEGRKRRSGGSGLLTTLLAAGTLLAAAGGAARADQVILDDLIVDGSQCIGIPCTDGMDFAYDSLVIRGDVVGVRFEDTSTSLPFPTNDWAIVVNDPDGTGTRERFSIEDLDAATEPFTIEAGAPSHSLHLGAGGVGIGTATPIPGAALDVNGTLRVTGNVDVAGTVTGVSGVKAGIIPKAAFAGGSAQVTFAAPYAGPYVILLTPVSSKASAVYRPSVLSQNSNGFTVSRGGTHPAALVEVHWMTQAVGE